MESKLTALSNHKNQQKVKLPLSIPLVKDVLIGTIAKEIKNGDSSLVFVLFCRQCDEPKVNFSNSHIHDRYQMNSTVRPLA